MHYTFDISVLVKITHNNLHKFTAQSDAQARKMDHAHVMMAVSLADS